MDLPSMQAIAPVLRDPDAFAYAMVDCDDPQELRKIDAGSFGSIFPGLLSKSKGTENLLYKGFFTGKYAPWDRKFSDGETNVANPRNEEEEERKKDKVFVPVVLKRLNSSKAAIDDIVREASNLYKVQGPRNIVSLFIVLNSKDLHGKTCLVMEKIDRNLKQLLTLRRSFGAPGNGVFESDILWWKTKLEIFREVVLGVMHCHRNGVYHGDLKGENIVVDRYLVPKLVDFGLSFRQLDLNYVKSLGSSWFWAAPEVLESAETISREVEGDPYPSDIYSLGMVLVEMSLDGAIPEEVSSSCQDNKFMDGPVEPFSIRDEIERALKSVLMKLEELVEECCKADRTERISLEGCLARVDEAYEELCSLCIRQGISLDTGASISGWRETLVKLRQLFPCVPDCIFYQLDKNMMLNTEGELLVHALCKVDCPDGIRYIIDNNTWNFQPGEDVPVMLILAVRSGSLSTLKFLTTRWKAIAAEQWVLVHEACNINSPELLRFLIFELDLPCDTWGREPKSLMPIHKLARQGKTKMLEVILQKNAELIDTFVDPYKCRTALYYAAKTDDMKTVKFLMEKSGTVYVPKGQSGRNIDMLFSTACKKGCLQVMAGLLELAYILGLEEIAGIGLEDCKERYELLKDYTDGVKLPGDRKQSLRLVCRKGNEAVFEAVTWMFFHKNDYSWDGSVTRLTKLIDFYLRSICEWGSGEMMQLMAENLSSETWTLGYLENPEAGRNGMDFFLRVAREHENKDVEKCLLQVQADLANKPTEMLATLQPSKEQLMAEEEEDRFSKLMELPSKAIRDGDLEGFKAVALKILDQERDTEKFLEACVERCCVHGRLECLKFLVSRGMALDHPKLCVLHRAAFRGKLEIMRYVLGDGKVPVDLRADHYGINNTPLLCASGNNHLEAVKLLLQSGASPNAVSGHGWSAMDDALLEKNFRMVRLLIEFGFDSSAKNRDNVRYMTLIANREHEFDHFKT